MARPALSGAPASRHFAVLAAIAMLLSGCAALPAMPAHSPAEAGLSLPPQGGFDYQLGGAYEPPAATSIVVRDSTQDPAPGAYGICYLNGFQSQPGTAAEWTDLLLEDDGVPVTDPGWPDEYLLDTSRSDRRQRIAERMRERIRSCARSGYSAVEFDNLDSYLRSHGRLTPAHNLALARLYITIAHDAGLAVAQKNALEIIEQAKAAGFDFAVTEECGAFDECAAYQNVYGVVLDVEYGSPAEFERLCEGGALPPGSLLRDRDLTTPASSHYVFARCG